jgi:hypothetical protein
MAFWTVAKPAGSLPWKIQKSWRGIFENVPTGTPKFSARISGGVWTTPGASRTIRRIKTMLADCLVVVKELGKTHCSADIKKLQLVAVARQESSASSAVSGTPSL